MINPNFVKHQLKIKAFHHQELLEIALTHPDAISENLDLTPEEQKLRTLEYLGISRLGSNLFSQMVSDYLYLHCSHLGSATCTLLKSDLVSPAILAQLTIKINLDQGSDLGKNYPLKPDFEQEKVLSELFEAVVGAVYLEWERDFEKTYNWLANQFLAGVVNQILMDLFIEFVPAADWDANFYPWFGSNHLTCPSKKSASKSTSLFCS
ncbi:Ribonuclease III [Planktothrix serta PCC 8927]|uniref:Ribonuclease III n=1 Tax=Planktothrix serta PCC 8927 TaxID=671068 RepID=A0A7Z9C003_9CYAN|nr:ribonuclease III domain-containing protein [Planktothrix serta]VXD24407.1 Ribonuclease III [Planktothrix serta PCC 8927]